VTGQTTREAIAAAVASLPAMTPQRLRKLACAASGPAGVEWERLWSDLSAGGARAAVLARASLEGAPRANQAGLLTARWTAAVREVDPDRVGAAYRDAGAVVALPGGDGYPPLLADDPEAPAVLFRRGEMSLPGPCAIAVVGTRSATHYGTDVAAELGAGLAAAGVQVISGLATGIDAAAHEGALSSGVGAEAAPPVAVVGAGLDVLYPYRTRRLRARVEEAGAVLSEAPLGAPPEQWRFPLRNRLIAALAQVVVVVESHRRGGALHTVEAALARDIEVMAVPGSIRSAASEGTNGLLASGAQIVTCLDDVLVALARRGWPASGRRSARAPGAGPPQPAPAPDTLDGCVLRAVDDTVTPTQHILDRTERELGEVALALDRLAELGLVTDCAGGWVRCR
jgi:DNA processing protein